MATMTNATEQNILNENNEKKMNEYERLRQERIKENFERMKQLGILDLSLKLKTANKPKPTKKYNNGSSSSTPQRESPMRRHVGPVRRSSRLGNATPVSYSEITLSKKGSFETDLLTEGSKPEVYTEDQLKLLGCSNTSWTLFVDGYGKDGKRIYDPVNGKTCHQCRQKTLGYRTQCSQCCKIQGQFCGDCLYMRYGENVLEALQNPDWICPVCRGICNCSLCRNAKGWAPTGIMYKKITKLGFKSVAHYLLQTATDSEKEGTKVPVSAKRSLAFSTSEATSMMMESADSKDNLKESVELKFEEDKMNENHKDDGSMPETKDQESLDPEPKDNCQHGENNIDGNVDAETKEGSAKISDDVVANKDIVDTETKEGSANNIDGNVVTETKEGSAKIGDDVVANKDIVQYMENEHCNSIVANQNSMLSERKMLKRSELIGPGRSVVGSEPDSIGARLRVAKIGADVITNKEDSVQYMENKHCDSCVAKNTAASKRKPPTPMPNSIGARLRARRRICSQ
ncbi:cell division cycle-associated protein 7 [Heracleum sosnowskyi]|uniref:Cell division cycle-associated protein 7 n=1 Tax=Heracleum sosnowskyi TaxID=360622 RepID=A0AAD8HA06_9APIA|nr:cell division cycle-associated protein 7 [Heracleum sosnowskyi]